MRPLNVFSVSALLLSACTSMSGEHIDLGTDRSNSEFSDGDRSESRNAESTDEDVAGASAPATVATSAQLVGSWISPACGRRTYVRQIEFNTDGKFAAQDLVSPCPPDVVCFWSGILHTLGTYEVRNETIELKLAQPRIGGGFPFPTTLELDPTTGAPTELAPEGGRCVYSRGTATPPPRPGR